MNVLFLSYNGLLEPILSSQAIPYLKDLSKHGYKFTLLTYEKKKDLDKAGRATIEQIKKDLARCGIEWVHLRYHKSPRMLATLFDIMAGSALSLYLILSRKIKIVHVRGVTPGAIMILLSGMSGTKLLFDMRGRLAEEMAAGKLWEEQSILFRLVKAAEKYLLKRADAVIVLTNRHFQYNEGLDYFHKRGIPKDVIPCCVDTSLFNYSDEGIQKTRKELGLDDRFVLMYQGKLGTFYFIAEMLDFYKQMLKIVPNAVLLILTADDPGRIEGLVKGKGLTEGNVRIFKNVPFAQIPRYLQIADAGVFFINAHEKLGSSPIKMGEFLACGVPVIINPGVGDTEEFVLEHKVGVVVENFDSAHYEKAINDLALLRNENPELKKICRQTAKAYLSKELAVAKYTKIYRSLGLRG